MGSFEPSLKKRNRGISSPSAITSENSSDSTSASISSLPPPRDLNCFLISDSDLPYERSISTNVFDVPTWLRYVKHKITAGRPAAEIVFVYERAVKAMPRSYKLWKSYLGFRVAHVSVLPPFEFASEYGKVDNCFRRCLLYLSNMPILWQIYLDFLIRTSSDVRHVCKQFDSALQSLPVAQHDLIWPVYLSYVTKFPGSVLAVKVWRRYVRLFPQKREQFLVALLENVAQSNGGTSRATNRITRATYIDEIVNLFMELLNDATFISNRGKSRFEMWLEFADTLIRHSRASPKLLLRLDVDAVFGSAINQFRDQMGLLYVKWAAFYAARRDFATARAVFERGLAAVMTVRDFVFVFDAYAEFEEAAVTKIVEKIAETETETEAEMGKSGSNTQQMEADLALLRLENLLSRRPFLLSDCQLRQNPNDATEWLKRATLWSDDLTQTANTFATAVATIDPSRVTGDLSNLWINYATLYERHNDFATVRTIFSKATNVPFRTPDELGEVWLSWAEFELRHNSPNAARKLLQTALATPKTAAPHPKTVNYFDSRLTPQARLFKCTKLWTFLCDLTEATGTTEETREIYEKLFELQIATPLTIANYASFLFEQNQPQEAYRVYEKGVAQFKFPVAFEIWNLYLGHVLARADLPAEHVRDLFEQAIAECPAELSHRFYIMYGKFEAERGLSLRSLKVYARGCEYLSKNMETNGEIVAQLAELYKVYVAKTEEMSGLTEARKVYESALSVLPSRYATEFGVAYAELEAQLGEIDRARKVFVFTAEISDPKRDFKLWRKWEEFELSHGNEETYREMLRVKRVIEAQQKSGVAGLGSAGTVAQQKSGSDVPIGFVKAKNGVEEAGKAEEAEKRDGNEAEVAEAENDDAIELDLDM